MIYIYAYGNKDVRYTFIGVNPLSGMIVCTDGESIYQINKGDCEFL